MKRIPLSTPVIKGNEWKYVKECLDSGWVSSVGSYVDRFEKEFASYVGSKHAIACVNGTSAIHIALILAGVKRGDEVIVPTLTFIAPVNVINYCGASPIFFDCDEYYNLDAKKVLRFLREETILKDGITINKRTGAHISAILPVHVFGNAVWLDELCTECKERNIAIVEDSTEGLGTRYTSGTFSGKHVGTIGLFGCFSFNGNKIITTGGGGMIVTDNSALADKARYLTTQAKNDGKRFVHDEVGYNYRLTNVLSAIGVAQLEQIEEFKWIKHSLFSRYKEGINSSFGIELAPPPSYASNNLWMFPLQITEKYGLTREQLMAKLEEHGIETRPVWHLNHLQKPYISCQNYEIAHAVHLLERTLNIPCSVDLTDLDQQRVIDGLNSKCA